MGRSRYHIQDNRYPYFITGTFVRWLPLFSQPKVASLFLDTIEYLQKHYHLQIFGWVLMENHFHLIARAPELSKVISILKSYSARKMIDEQIFGGDTLHELRFANKSHKSKQEYQVWQEGSHPECIFNREIMMQKIEYIHSNPVKRGYVDRGEQWRYSSARNYCGDKGLLDTVCEW